MILTGRIVRLRPMTMDDRPLFFEMTTKSDATPYLYGTSPPTWEELFDDHKDYYFDGTQPEKGRCFAILIEDRVIGQVYYNDIDRQSSCVEFDIWIAEDSDTGKGAGSDALRTLIAYLHDEMQVDNFVICPSASNPRAIRAYEKAGFTITGQYEDDTGGQSYRMEQSLGRRASEQSGDGPPPQPPSPSAAG